MFAVEEILQWLHKDISGHVFGWYPLCLKGPGLQVLPEEMVVDLDMF